MQALSIEAAAPPEAVTFRAAFLEAPLTLVGVNVLVRLVPTILGPLSSLEGRGQSHALVTVKGGLALTANEADQIGIVDVSPEAIPLVFPILFYFSGLTSSARAGPARPFRRDARA